MCLKPVQRRAGNDRVCVCVCAPETERSLERMRLWWCVWRGDRTSTAPCSFRLQFRSHAYIQPSPVAAAAREDGGRWREDLYWEGGVGGTGRCGRGILLLEANCAANRSDKTGLTQPSRFLSVCLFVLLSMSHCLSFFLRKMTSTINFVRLYVQTNYDINSIS